MVEPVPPDTPCRELSGNPPPLGRPIKIARRMGPGSGTGAPAPNSKMTESNDNWPLTKLDYLESWAFGARVLACCQPAV